MTDLDSHKTIKKLTRQLCDNALRPKSEILKFPTESSKRFSGWNKQENAKPLSICIREYINQINILKWQFLWQLQNLKVSMIHALVVTIIHNTNKLLKILSCLIFLQPLLLILFENMDSCISVRYDTNTRGRKKRFWIFFFISSKCSLCPQMSGSNPFQAIICANSPHLSHIHHKSKGHSKTKWS